MVSPTSWLPAPRFIVKTSMLIRAFSHFCSGQIDVKTGYSPNDGATLT